MKKVLVHAKTRPLPIHVYKQLLLNSGSPATTSAVQDSDTAAQVSDIVMSQRGNLSDPTLSGV